MSATLHEAVVPLMFLVGRWRGEGTGGYANMEGFRYGEEVVFSHVGKPYLAYTQRTWSLDGEERPLHAECGYWRPQPGGRLEIVMAHPSGIAEIYYGTITGTRLELATDIVARTVTAKEVSALTRLYGLVEGKLMYAVDMAAMGEPMQPHLSGVLERVPD